MLARAAVSAMPGRHILLPVPTPPATTLLITGDIATQYRRRRRYCAALIISPRQQALVAPARAREVIFSRYIAFISAAADIAKFLSGARHAFTSVVFATFETRSLGTADRGLLPPVCFSLFYRRRAARDAARA